MTSFRNPAGRLHEVLAKIAMQNPNTPLVDAWKTAVGARDLPDFEFMRRLGLVFQLPLEAVAEHEKIDPAQVNPDINLRWRNPVQQVLGEALGMLGRNSMGSVNQLTDGVMLSLESCSDALDRHRPQPSADNSDLNSLRESVIAVRDELDASNVDDELREFIGRLVGAMLRAIDDYPLRGSSGLRDALEQVTGALAVHRDELVKVVKEQPKLWERIDKALGRFASICIIVTFGLQLPGMAAQAIEGTDQPASQTAVVQRDDRHPGTSSTSAAHTGDAASTTTSPTQADNRGGESTGKANQ